MHFPATEMKETIDRFAITQGQKIVQTTIEFFSWKEKIENIDKLGYNQRPKILLKQRLNFPGKEKIETMDGLAIILGQHTVETNGRIFPVEKKRFELRTMERLAIIQSQKIVESTGCSLQEQKRWKLLIAWQ